ncbi:MoaD/ThiS family protein [Marinomonas pollencensis]|uniref:Molybdopterin synthase subunit MoaD n=1 Tax=Marinomonas pollencensis TaxID=491954 RepID=A0A3E0DRQ3_9GAMM|nr:MoaD/ThiS family protein [Marinomonas pollencensis]REG85837.1 molybdopterin synthase subunit MoaD [Marinomonas pollencensis]
MTNVNVLFFASLKETLGISEYQLAGNFPMTIRAVKQQLSAELAKGDALLGVGIQSSIDYEFARDADLVASSAQEIAFFPPVTGG